MPVFTGLGHEIDRSVADEVAHTAFKTPTACAAALIDMVDEFASRAEYVWAEIAARSARRIDASDAGLLEKARRIQQRTLGAVDRAEQRLADRAHRLVLSSGRALDHGTVALDRSVGRLARRPLQLAVEQSRTIDQIEARVRLLDPVHTLARGWSLTRTADGRIVRDPSDIAIGDAIVTTLANGTLTSTVDTRTARTTTDDAMTEDATTDDATIGGQPQ